MKNQIDLFVEDIENRVAEECRLLRNEAIPRTMMKKYILQIGWREHELAAYLKKRMERELGEQDEKIERFNTITFKAILNVALSMAVASLTTILVMISQTK